MPLNDFFTKCLRKLISRTPKILLTLVIREKFARVLVLMICLKKRTPSIMCTCEKIIYQSITKLLVMWHFNLDNLAPRFFGVVSELLAGNRNANSHLCCACQRNGQTKINIGRFFLSLELFKSVSWICITVAVALKIGWWKSASLAMVVGDE